MTPPDQKKTNWLLIWILSIAIAPLIASFFLLNEGIKLGLIFALLIINFIASLKISKSQKSDGSMSSFMLNIFMKIWLILLGMKLIFILLFAGYLMVSPLKD